jgi:DNA-binding winged helix-turn-helix (wHTH) protein
VRVHCGEFVLDRAERVLVRDGVEQALEPKVFDCLALLVAHAGKLTSMEQLRSTLWPDVSVG